MTEQATDEPGAVSAPQTEEPGRRNGPPASLLRRARTVGREAFIERPEPVQTEPAERAEEEPTVDQELAALTAPIETPPANEPAVPAWLEHVREVPPEELLTHHQALQQHVSGRIGSEAQMHAQRLAQQQMPAIEERVRAQLEPVLRPQITAEVRRELEDQELLRIRDSDPLEYVDRQRALEEQRRQQQADADIAAAQQIIQAQRQPRPVPNRGPAQPHPLQAVADLLDPQDAAELSQRYYAPTSEGAAQYVADARERIAARITAQTQAEQQKKLPQYERQIREAERKSTLAAVNSGESPDTGISNGAGNTTMTYNQFRVLPMAERQRLRKENPSLYDRIMAS